MILVAIAEVLSIGAVIPFITVLIDPDRIFNLEMVKPALIVFNIKNSSELILPMTTIFCLAAVISGTLRVLLLWLKTKLCHSIGIDISRDVFKKTLFQDYENHISRNSSEIISAITNKVKIVVYEILWPLLLMFSSFIIFVSIFCSLIIIEPFIALILFSFLGIMYVFIILTFKKHLNNYSKIISVFEDVKLKLLQEGLMVLGYFDCRKSKSLS